MNYLKYTFLSILLIGLFSCEPYVEEKTELGALPTPTFEISQGDTPYDFILTNTTPDAFLTNWSLEDVGEKTGEEIVVDYNFAGTYEVTMTTFNRSGSASITKTITVDQDNPDACFGNFELLTGCGEKIWKIAPEEGALYIGSSLENQWWANGEGDVAERVCHFDDLYIFRENGQFEYNNNGDFWADSDDTGTVWPSDLGLNVGCHDEESWPDAYKAWGSGVHSFNITDNTLTVIGEGAWMGLYKIGTASEVTSPQSAVTFSINSLTENRMVLVADYGDSVWKVIFVSE